jgi:pimeloyl-ACP methyl ester carboxylesterase
LAAETEQLPFTGASVDHREAEACFEPAPRAGDGYRRIYPDLPGLGRTPAPLSLRSAETSSKPCGFVDWVSGHDALLVVGHSAGCGKCRLLPPEGATSQRTPSYWIGTTARIDGPGVAL